MVQPEVMLAGMRRSRDLRNARTIPFYGDAVFEVLQFSRSDVGRIRSLTDSDWTKLLQFCDAAQLTFTFAHKCGSEMPDWVKSRISRNQSDSGKRNARLSLATTEISHRFDQKGIDVVLLKGSAYAQEFTPDPSLRSTADIDLLCRPDVLTTAQDELLNLGYRSFGSTKGRHLPPMVREAEWHWRGDYYAADLPIPVDLHYKLWDEELEQIPGPPEDEFWSRRSRVCCGGEMLPVLGLPDALAFSALHLLMHILHGDVRLQRAWEIGYFLHNRATDEAFWFDWKRLHGPELRTLQVLVFLLVKHWFGCKLPFQIEDEAKQLSPDIKLWIDRYAWSPVETLFAPNKHELWLNLLLVGSRRGKAKVIVRRMLPLYASKAVCAEAHKAEARAPVRSTHKFKYLASRAIHHARTLPPTVAEGIKWWCVRQRGDRP